MNVLVLAAHPDDECLGCGATIAKHADAGDKVHVIVVGEGATSRLGASSADVNRLQSAAERAAEILGATIGFLGLPDNRLDAMPLLRLVQAIERKYAENPAPNTVYTHSLYDLNVDHRLVAQAALTLFRPLPEQTCTRILSFPSLSSTHWLPNPQFNPNVFVDIESTLERKLKALACYESEMRPFPHARSIETVRAMATYYGGLVGRRAVEPFELLRKII